MATIPNPPNAPNGYVARWNGNSWEIVKIEAVSVPAMPEGLPKDCLITWNGTEWVISTPPTPTPDQITSGTISDAVQGIKNVAYLTTSEMGQHITPESRQEVTDYIHAVANILATAQQKYGTGEAYEPEFPPQPVVGHQQLTNDCPVIRFVAGE